MSEILAQIMSAIIRVEKKLDIVHAAAIAAVPPSRRTNRIKTGEFQEMKDLRKLREAEVLRVFFLTAHLPRDKKEAQKFHRGLLEPSLPKGRPSYELVPLSVLRNRCAMRKVFAPIADEGELSAENAVDRTIVALVKAGALYEITMDDATQRGYRMVSQTKVIASPSEWQDIQNYRADPTGYTKIVKETEDERDHREMLEERVVEANRRAKVAEAATIADGLIDIPDNTAFSGGRESPKHPSDAEFDMAPIGEQMVEELGADEPTNEEVSAWSLKR